MPRFDGDSNAECPVVARARLLLVRNLRRLQGQQGHGPAPMVN